MADKKKPRLCEECKEKPAEVGLNQVWMCVDCFSAELKKAGDRVRRIRDHLGDHLGDDL